MNPPPQTDPKKAPPPAPAAGENSGESSGPADLSQIVSLCKRRGFLFPSSEIYGGLNSCWDYGPLGAQLKLNIKRIWLEEMTRRPDISGLDSSIFMRPEVWKASGHLESFSDPLSDCRDCKARFRRGPEDSRCPECGSENLTKTRQFHLMFKSFMGPVEGEEAKIYLRPETAQGIYVNFLNIQKTMRKSLPFGVAQIGKAFRNEITPSHFIFRMREFEQMEMQFFVPPEEGPKWFSCWRERRMQSLLNLGLPAGRLHFHEHGPGELAHYARAAADIEYDFPMGRRELEGIHNRGDFDLSRHEKFSGKKLRVFDAEQNKSILPHVIETSIGCDRLFLAILCSSYHEEDVRGERRLVLRLKKQLAPAQIAVLPLSKKQPLIDMARKIHEDLQKNWFVDYDESGGIGRRYRRQDEIGTPYCATIDFESLSDGMATVRDRDTMRQERLPAEGLAQYFKDSLP